MVFFIEGFPNTEKHYPSYPYPYLRSSFSLYYLDNDEVSEALDLGGECEAEEEGEEAGAEHAHG